MIIITVTGFEAATINDVLQGTRLQTVPRNGILAIELQANLNDATNAFSSSIQLPDGTTPFTGMRVPSGNNAIQGTMDSRLAYRATFKIEQGGHCVLDFAETGVAVVFWRVTFKGML